MQKQVFNLSEVKELPSPLGKVARSAGRGNFEGDLNNENLPSLSFGHLSERKCAFTLAEVLITLGVIGVISAMTMPTLIKNYQKTVTATRLKATYSTISQAIKMSEVDNGPVATWEIPVNVNSYNTQKAFADTYFKPYLKNIKVETGNSPKFILNNGVVMAVVFQDGKNIQIGIDINGKQGPNTTGKDRFTIIVNAGTTNDIIGKNQPAGSVHFFCQGNTVDFLRNNAKRGCNKNAYGSCCGAWIMENGWKIPDEYPW